MSENSRPHSQDQLLLWADCEFTGYFWEHPDHRILEIAALVTDLSLNEIDHYESFIQCDPDKTAQLIALNPVWARGPNPELPRLLAGSANAPPLETVDHALTELHDTYFRSSRKTPLAGNSVYFDNLNIQHHFAHFGSRLSHQVIDVSSFAIMAKKMHGIRYRGKTYAHEALSDIRESVDELRFLRAQIGGIGLLPLIET